MRARWITGGSPSASTRLPVQAALERPFTRPRPALISPPRTLFGFAAPATLLSHRFGLDLLVGAIICTAFLVCQPFFSHPTKRATDSSRPSAMHTTLFLFQCFHCLFQSLSLQCIGHPAQVVHIVHRCHQRKDRNHYASYQ